MNTMRQHTRPRGTTETKYARAAKAAVPEPVYGEALRKQREENQRRQDAYYGRA